METTISLRPEELDSDMLDMVKLLVKKSGFKEIRISMSDNKPVKRLRKESPAELDHKITLAMRDIKEGNTSHHINFSAEEFEQFSQSLLKK